MRRLTYENNRGESIIFYLSPLVITSLTGIGEVAAAVQSQTAPFQDGDSYIDTLLDPRYIDMEATITRTQLKDIKDYRQYILRVCNPKLGPGKITLELDGDTKEIEAVLEGSPTFPERGQDVWQSFSVSWKCPNPYWKDPNQTSQPLQAYSGNFKLPFKLPFKLGVSGSRTILYNNGDIPAPVSIDIQGPATNPQIINRTNGDWLRVNRSIAADEILHIDTTSGRKRVEVYHDGRVYNVFGYLDHDSNWLQLVVGPNEIEHIADAGDRSGMVAVTWNNQYVGI